ncbi:hypothetical protein V6N13_134853 [Hibiscus sabdariffa]
MSSKSAAVEDSRENHQGRLKRKGPLEKVVQRANSSGRKEVVRTKDKYVGSGGGDVKVLPINKKSGGSNRFQFNDQVEEKRVLDKFEVVEENKGEKCGVTIAGHHPGSERVLSSIEGEQVAAGWPAWLVAVASEAINGWIPRRANSFEKLNKFFTTEPLACDPSSLPKYPPSKEIDAKLRDEEARRSLCYSLDLSNAAAAVASGDSEFEPEEGPVKWPTKPVYALPASIMK